MLGMAALPDPSRAGLTEMPDALRRGYATAGTDTGHQDPGGDWAIGHPEKMIDFGYRATHEMTLKAKEIVKAFYDQPARYSYFKGCSTGGRMALMEAQRYPGDYQRHHCRLCWRTATSTCGPRASREASSCRVIRKAASRPRRRRS